MRNHLSLNFKDQPLNSIIKILEQLTFNKINHIKKKNIFTKKNKKK